MEKELTIDSNELYEYIGEMPEHTAITQTDMMIIFKMVFMLHNE